MNRIVTPTEAKEWDRYCIETLHVPSERLMLRAAEGLEAAVLMVVAKSAEVYAKLMAGSGNETVTSQHRADTEGIRELPLNVVKLATDSARDDVMAASQENDGTGYAEPTAPTLKNIYRLRENAPDGIKVPIRKIELVPQGPTVLREECTTTKIKAVVYPANADMQELIWRVTDDAGVDSTFASIHWEKENSTEATITVKGDGSFRVRCMCKNGKQAYDLISVLEYRAEGLGVRNLNPYEFLSASLCSATGGQIGNGNERGISTQRDGVSWVAYENLDFGSFGSDEVEIPVFSFDSLTPFTFWEGIPHAKGSHIIGTKDYTLPRVWNTYIPDTFKLDKRLRGITTFAVELDRKIHMKGFQFAKQEKAFAKLYAAEADTIYGDSYEKQDRAICGIGNNVTLVFESMDFGDKGIEKLVICGKTPHEMNDIRLLTEWEDGRKEQEALQFTYAEEATELIFDVAKKTGKAKISSVASSAYVNCSASCSFLPSSHSVKSRMSFIS